MEIKDISGNVILSVTVTKDAVHTKSLMETDSCKLSWKSDKYAKIPLGTYIEWDGRRYSLTAPYIPEIEDEAEFRYEPEFVSRIMRWKLLPFFFVEYTNDAVTSCETDWTLTYSPSQFMKAVCNAIRFSTDEIWTFAVDSSLTKALSISFQGVDIISGLNSIASSFGTEWWADEDARVLHLGKCSIGDTVSLTVGQNVGSPSVNKVGDGFYTRFYAFGSTRNITQKYSGGTSSIYVAQKRLALPKSTCPNGYKDIKSGLSEAETNVKVLIFDDVYPHAGLKLTDVRSKQDFVRDSNGKKVQISTDSNGNPVYDTYNIYYFKLSNSDGTPFVFDSSTYSEENPGGMVLEGMKLSVSFRSGLLNGREYELIYHKGGSTDLGSDYSDFYEIIYDSSSGAIIPNIYLYPVSGDECTLFNIKMPDSYVSTGEQDLENELDKAIAEYTADKDIYTLPSYTAEFMRSGLRLDVGRKVRMTCGSYQLETRVTKIEEHMDIPYDCTLTIGESLVKGSISEVKEEVSNVSRDVEVIKALGDMTNTINSAYSLTQQKILASLARWSDMFTLETDKNGTTYVRAKYDLMSERGVATYSGMEAVVPSVFSGMPIDGKSIYWDNGILKSYNVGGDGHTHENKGVLDTLTPGLIKEWNTAYAKSHTHQNEAVIDEITQDSVDNWDTAYANNHTHQNKATLDGVSGTKVGEWNNKVASVVLDGLLLKVNNAGTVVTYSVPIASDTANGAVSTTAQTYAGRKTFKNGIIANGIDFESDTQIAQQWFKSTIDGVMTTFGAIGTYGNGIDMFIACQRSGKQLYLANDGRLGYGDWDNGMAYLKVEKDADGNAIFSYENNIKTPNYIQIGDYRIVVDTANNALKIVKADGTAANLIVSGGTTTYE